MFTRSYGSDHGGGGASDDYACNIGIDTDSCYDYVPPKEDPESKFVDVYHHPLKEEPEQELGDGDGGAGDDDDYARNIRIDADDPTKQELVNAGDDTDADSGPDVGYDCSHCGISVCTQEVKVKHELRCKAQIQRREFESQVTEVYHCGYCMCPFLNKDYREQHQQRWCRKRPGGKIKDSNGTHFECDKCEYVTKWKQNLERHFLTHNKNDGEWFTCTHCSYKTVRKYSMTRHMEIHGNTFSCCCSICGKSFRTKQSLDGHLLKQHYDELDQVSTLITSKIYTCNICDRFRTTLKTNFNKHLAVTHLKGVGCQKYECPRCPYSTFRKMNLERHSKTHTEQKDYRCAVCKKQFTHKGKLDSHVLNIHADNVDLVKTVTSKIHRCELCSFKTIASADLKGHVRSKHI